MTTFCRTPLERVQARMARVDMSDPTACHEWPAARSESGYGLVGRGRRGSGIVRVTRVVLEEKLGRPIAPGMFALHTCDNPPCCNLAHLYEGSRLQNTIDAIVRGRHHTKLTEDEVRAIRADRRTNAAAIARDYGVSRTLIRGIQQGRNRALVSKGTVL